MSRFKSASDEIASVKDNVNKLRTNLKNAWTAKRCDRCGKFYQIYGVPSVTILYTPLDYVCNLCSDCQIKLEQFIKIRTK